MDVFELRKEAQEKLGLNDAQADAFVEGFIKEASGFDPFFNRNDNNSSIGHRAAGHLAGEVIGSFGKAIGGGVGNVILNSAVTGVAGIVGSARDAVLYRKFTEALKQVIDNNRIVRNADRDKVMSYAQTIYKFAPHVAADANVLTQLLANAIHGEGVDPNTSETITRLEERHSGSRGFQPKTFTG